MKRRRSIIGERGFTLIELLVVIAIAGLLLSVAAPRLSDSVVHAHLKATAARLSIALKDTRAMAMKTAQSAALSVAPSGQSYRALGAEIKLPEGQTLSFRPFGQEQDNQSSRIEFLTDGSSGGGVFTIANGRGKIRVDIDWVSGRVSLRE